MSDEIKEALKELRELFPRGSIQVDVGMSEFDDGDFLSSCSIVVQRASINSAKRWRGDSLAECMTQVRHWKRNEK